MFDQTQKRMLALDGGGILGLISLGILKQVEADLRAASGKPDLVLRDFFDYIGGTSTGAIIAAALSVGRSVDEIIEIYTGLGDKMFDLTWVWNRWRRKFDADNLVAELKKQFTDQSIYALQEQGVLSKDKHLLVVTRNINTDSPWPISTNRAAKYNDLSREDCNLLLPLWQLVRASTAAPTYFMPERITLGSITFDFEDGGVTAYNNPAFLLYRMATDPAYRCDWSIGEDKLMLLSVGTGMAYRTLAAANRDGESLLTTAMTVPSELMRTIAVEQDKACRTVGRCVHGAPLDSEVDTMVRAHDAARPKHFLYARYDADLSKGGLISAELGDLDPKDLTMDDAEKIPALKVIGAHAAKQVDMAAHFGPFLKGRPGAGVA